MQCYLQGLDGSSMSRLPSSIGQVVKAKQVQVCLVRMVVLPGSGEAQRRRHRGRRVEHRRVGRQRRGRRATQAKVHRGRQGLVVMVAVAVGPIGSVLANQEVAQVQLVVQDCVDLLEDVSVAAAAAAAAA